ncbi:uncharacterized protein LOC132167696 [Corylus avellana]|uniref:uncharacterized protein LOC132167696 n=1 Tax=Corylus avellana TaxID=13451 RepID=UPI00286A6B67|nr:uncharacterized protein LOC132167696 [Corylus avellana]
MEIIKHSCHEHVLSLTGKKREDLVLCIACEEYCDEGLIYSCRTYFCRFNLHESCAKLPQELHNPLLHPHPLSLLLPDPKYRSVYCKACGNFCMGFTFCCEKCDVDFDVNCAFIRPAIEEEEEGEEAVVVGTHCSHGQHPLLLFHKIVADRIRCRLCETYCSDPMTYGCLPCGFFLHPSCFNLPEEIFHPFHPYHGPLTLKRIKDKGSRRCNACRQDIRDNLAYFCEYKNCSFCLDIECTSVIMPAITYQGHDHLLQFNDSMKNIDDELIKCSACKSSCESYGFRCLYCDFNLHHTCGPLPSTIKHKSHIHPLILTNSPAQHEDETDDEFYCDACEEERLDPLILPIYQCIQCHFAADIKCLTSEVISLLNGEYGDVELINPLGQFGKVITKDAAKEMVQTKDKKQLELTLTWEDVLKTLREDENENEVVLLEARIKEITTARWIEPYDREEIKMFCDKACPDFMEFGDDDKYWSYKFPYDWYILSSITKEEVVNVGDYMTTRRLAPILNHLLSNYGNIGAESTSSPKGRSLYFCMLCECIDRMRNTKVVDITIGILLSWWRCLKILQFAGFKIEFAFDRLKRVTHAHFGLYVEKQVDNTVDQIEKCTRKLEYIKSAKSNLIEECLREALILKKEKAVPSRLL